jgi:hypothetical protein
MANAMTMLSTATAPSVGRCVQAPRLGLRRCYVNVDHCVWIVFEPFSERFDGQLLHIWIVEVDRDSTMVPPLALELVAVRQTSAREADRGSRVPAPVCQVDEGNVVGRTGYAG